MNELQVSGVISSDKTELPILITFFFFFFFFTVTAVHSKLYNVSYSLESDLAAATSKVVTWLATRSNPELAPADLQHNRAKGEEYSGHVRET